MPVKLFDRFDVSTPAFVIFVAGLIMGIIIVLIQPSFWMIGLLVVLLFFVAAYNVNCTLVGNCKYWALFLTSFYVSYAILISISLLMNPSMLTGVEGSDDAPSSPPSATWPRRRPGPSASEYKTCR